MAPGLRLLLLLPLGAGCATPADREALALHEAMTSAQATLAVSGGGPVLRVSADGPKRAPLAAGTAPASAAELLGLSPEALRRRLGEPALRRREGDAEIWLYAAEACGLDVVLYRDAGRLRVAHAAARASGAAPRTEDACLREIAGAALPIGTAAGAGG